MANQMLVKTYVAEAAITKYRIVKPGTADGQVVQAAAAADAAIGVCAELSADINARADVVQAGIADVEFGGTVTRGALLTSDASGKAVAAAPAAGSNARIIGVALHSAASGDIGQMLIAPSSMQG